MQWNYDDSAHYPKIAYYNTVSGEWYDLEFEYNVDEWKPSLEQLDSVKNIAPSGAMQSWKGETVHFVSFLMKIQTQAAKDAWVEFMKIACGGSEFKFYPDKSLPNYTWYTSVDEDFEPDEPIWERYTWRCSWRRRTWAFSGQD